MNSGRGVKTLSCKNLLTKWCLKFVMRCTKFIAIKNIVLTISQQLQRDNWVCEWIWTFFISITHIFTCITNILTLNGPMFLPYIYCSVIDIATIFINEFMPWSFWVMAMCSVVVGYQCFKRPCCIHLYPVISLYGVMKHWYPTTPQHSVITQKTTTQIITMKMWNFTSLMKSTQPCLMLN